MLQRPSNSLNAKGVTILKLRVLSTKRNIKAGALNNPYALAGKVNKAVKKIFYILCSLCLAKQKGQVK